MLGMNVKKEAENKRLGGDQLKNDDESDLVVLAKVEEGGGLVSCAS